ncbi:hypothetical protein ACFOSC_26465 [Streptantibioticus rubrisoli]|uniref:Phage metallopeptidase domain-containing protein n=1 Tax=Streptantibioticus rubrisoli TaxID=1387313 RepID=A0ABT1PH94_9ACTN|nr:hypothetical protein [Streptantibioticus rubrisoli]MCQ4043878.1 hypothetical protein [Streptantibioticus rubrisoli]
MLDAADLPTPLAEVAAGAAVFVERRLSTFLPPTTIVVANRVQLAMYAVRAATAVAGGRPSWLARLRYGFAMWREARTGLACTALSPTGVLIVVTRRALDDRWLTDYFVHEFVHAVQAGRPGRREQMTELLRFDLGLAAVDEEDLYAEDLRQQAEEGEAYRIQAEHAGVIDVGGMPWRP